MQTDVSKNFRSAILCVDIAVIKDNRYLLLGRKPKEEKFRFLGGFVDIKDDGALQAAQRELKEEAGDIKVEDWIFISNVQVKDSRYATDRCKIFTNLYMCDYVSGEPKGSDDIAEVKWFDITNLNKLDINPVHHILFDCLFNHGKV